MNLLKLLLFILVVLLRSNSLSAQHNNKPSLHPKFDEFSGEVYSMPTIERKLGKGVSKGIREHYSKEIYNYEKIGDINLERIDIPNTHTDQGVFPGVDRSTKFCMILNSTMYIELDACYEFSLNSDDGSILWINGNEVVNNDGGHKMRLRKDTIPLTKGQYDIKLWYFQGLPDRFGLVLNSKLVGKISSCESQVKSHQFEINCRLLFDSGEYLLTESAKTEMDNLYGEIKDLQVKSIEVVGHTDNVGDNKSNQILSQKRAETIADELYKVINSKKVLISAIGKGESQPKTTNKTEEGREKNRRVEIIIN